jgi:3-oxoacyl-ACP reductase-like protein
MTVRHPCRRGVRATFAFVVTALVATAFSAAAPAQSGRPKPSIDQSPQVAPSAVEISRTATPHQARLATANSSETQIVDSESDLAAVALMEIVTWLSQNFGLPTSDQMPKVGFMAPARIAALYYRGPLGEQRTVAINSRAMPDGGSEIMAVYEPARETIYLPEGWRGTTPAEMSVLVHELVHHLQHRAQLKFACPQEREKVAYAAQARWLEQFGRSLFSEFETDPMTLILRTNCGF